jgi:biopolymer transport protein ExbB/TolQ
MTGPRLYLVRMVLFLLAVGALAVALAPGLIPVFWHHPQLNGLILGVLAIGIVYNLRQVYKLRPQVEWIEQFRGGDPRVSADNAPRALAAMAATLGERRGRISLSTATIRSILDSIASRLDEAREISRYMVALQIFLGLLGTFWGLLQVVGGVTGVIGSLSATRDIGALFNDLQAGLQQPLAGMGTAFGTSLFGLAGSLVLGFLDLQAGQAQNRFYNELEEWLSSMTRLGAAGAIADGEQPAGAYVQALLEQTADNLEALQRTIARAEEGRAQSNQTIAAVIERLDLFTDQMRTEQSLMMRLAESQAELKPALARFADASNAGGLGLDETTRAHIRNLDLHLARLNERVDVGFVRMTDELRQEIRLLARTIAALAEDDRREQRPAAGPRLTSHAD